VLELVVSLVGAAVPRCHRDRGVAPDVNIGR